MVSIYDFEVLSLALIVIGHIWLGYRVWRHGSALWAGILMLVPMPLIGLYVWSRDEWSSDYVIPAVIYFLGYGLKIYLLASIAHGTVG